MKKKLEALGGLRPGVQKLFLLMRLTIFLILASVLVSTASVYSQATKLTVKMNNCRIAEVFDAIEEQSEFYFFYNRDNFDDNQIVSVDFTGKTVDQILDELFAGQAVTYEIVDKSILIKTQARLSDLSVSKQQNAISGKVTDTNGLPLPGVTVVIKGTANGTITDVNGEYSLPGISATAVLQFSFVGMRSQEITVNGQTVINITLEEETIGLDEVVAVGYGTMKKSDLTGSMTSVSSKDFERQPMTRIGQTLQGRSSGVQVSETSGAPGSEIKIRIRGTNSINGSNEPLYIVDGLAVESINSINTNDIASMEILKDASATAIYGSRGANGVILITTKSGSEGKTKIVVDTYHSFSSIVKKLPKMNGAEFAEGVNFSEGYDVFSEQEIAALAVSGGEDWQDRIFQTANLSSTQLSVSGGNKALNYYVSGNYLTQDGVVIGKDYKRYSFRSKIEANLSSKISLNVNVYGSRAESDGYSASLFNALTFDPTTPAYDENGDYNFTSLKNVATGSINPLLYPNEAVAETRNNQVIANSNLIYKITNDLTLNVSFGLEQLFNTNNSYVPILIDATGTAAVIDRKAVRYQNTNILTYDKVINDNHKIKIDAIYEQQSISNIITTSEASQFLSDATTYKNLALGAIQRVSNSSTSESLKSYVGRVNYSLLNKYLLTFTVRADGSSKFQKDKWGIFPSGSLAYRLSEENFIKNIGYISNFKLRSSYGITGSQAIDPLATREEPLIGTDYNYPFSGSSATIGLAPSDKIANPDLTWEQTAQINIGTDIGLLDSRINFSFDWYKKNTTDLLLDVTLPEFVGANIITRNIGEVENKGIEISMGVTAVKTKDLNISTNLSFSRNRNEVIALVDGTPIEKGDSYLTTTFPVNPTRVEVGLPISSFRGYVFEGVYQLGEEEEAAIYGKAPGDAKYKDINGDDNITTEDIVTIGDGNPDFTWGLNTFINYKKLDVNILLQGSHGNDVYNFTRGRMMSLGEATFHATHKDFINRWTTENPSNIPSSRNGTELLSSQFLEDGSFIRVKNVSVSYTIDDNELASKLGIESVRVYASAENLLTLTDYRGFDPEATASGNSDVDLGIDLNAYPVPRSFTLGFSINF